MRWILLVYLLLCALFYRYQQYFFFRPKPVSKHYNYQFAASVNYRQAAIPFDSNNIIDVAKFLPADTAKGVVLFFHGNRWNIEHYSSYAPFFTKNGYECWMPDYPGYGRSTGELSVESLQKTAIQLYKMARAKYPANQIVIYGKSLGTGIAAFLASERDCRHLLLETPYQDLSSVASQFLFFMPVDRLMQYNFNTAACIGKISAPITVFHGNKDQLILLGNAVKLAASMKMNDAFYVIEGGNHLDLPDFPLYHKVLDSVLSR